MHHSTVRLLEMCLQYAYIDYAIESVGVMNASLHSKYINNFVVKQNNTILFLFIKQNNKIA
jgi:hypothetical protein